MEKYMRLALLEAEKAYEKGEVPIGCVIIKNDKVIAKAHNLKEKKYDSTSHAEINAIKKAGKKLKNWRLNDCELYVTKQPCEMCMSAIKQSRIKKVVYGMKTENYDYEKFDVELVNGVLEEESITIIQRFFQSRRNKNK